MRHALVLLLLVACSKTTPPPEDDASSPPLSDWSQGKPLRIAFAHFENQQLVDCSDVVTTRAVDEVEKAFADQKRINQPCAAAFADRVTLALCTVNARTDAGGSMMLTVAHYDFAAVGLSDKSMSKCLSEGGHWNPLKRDSTAFRKAKLEYEQGNSEGGSH